MTTKKTKAGLSAAGRAAAARSAAGARFGTRAEAVDAARELAAEDRYEALADAVERGEFTPVPGTLSGPLLKMGRPAAAAARRGKSPVRTLRLPHELDERLTEYAGAADSTPSDVLRQAVVEYMDRHPLGA